MLMTVAAVGNVTPPCLVDTGARGEAKLPKNFRSEPF